MTTDALALCAAPTRAWGGQPGGLCLLKAKHRGHHSSVVFTCDECGEVRRGRPHHEDPDTGVGICFLCDAAYQRRRDRFAYD